MSFLGGQMSKPVVFISYSHKDEKEKNDLVKHLRVLSNEFDLWVDDNIPGGGKWEQEIEKAIGTADMGVLLISANFLTSDFITNNEIPLLLRRCEKDGMLIYPIIATDCAWTNIEWLSEFNARPKNRVPVFQDGGKLADQELAKIAGEIVNILETKNDNIPNSRNLYLQKKSSNWPSFQNRKDELDNLLDSLKITGGDRFFLLISGPQMGKTWLLGELEQRLNRTNIPWMTVYKNLKTIDFSSDKTALELLVSYFNEMNNNIIFAGRERNQVVHDICLFLLKQDIPFLLLLDQAELLDESVAKELRQLLVDIRKELEKSGKSNVDLAFIAASCLEIKSWKGVRPSPSFHIFVLSHFKKKVIEDALYEMANIDDRKKMKPDWYANMALSLDSATEGLPALLMKYMEYIRGEEYLISPDDLNKFEIFERIAFPYIDTLLSSISLGPASPERGDEEIKKMFLKKVLLKLSPYRWISESHLERILDDDPEIRMFFDEISWDIRDLWYILSQTYLIRPSETIWHEMYPGIRRLLFRYYERNLDAQKNAHEQAYVFLGEWWQEVHGTDRGLYVIENLWHFVENRRLNFAKPENKDREILDHAREILSKALQPNHNTIGDLAKYVTMRLEKDIEIQDSMDEINSDLFQQVIDMVDILSKQQET